MLGSKRKIIKRKSKPKSIQKSMQGSGTGRIRESDNVSLEKRFDFDVPQDRSRPEYANWMNIRHNPYEFIVEVGHMSPGKTKPNVRICHKMVVSPQHMKQFADVIVRSIQRYESTFGGIKQPATGPGSKKSDKKDESDKMRYVG
ncbi:DUF3467 domain-containing protein [Candidatus Aenigmatarchaeota archaeon]